MNMRRDPEAYAELVARGDDPPQPRPLKRTKTLPKIRIMPMEGGSRPGWASHHCHSRRHVAEAVERAASAMGYRRLAVGAKPWRIWTDESATRWDIGGLWRVDGGGEQVDLIAPRQPRDKVEGCQWAEQLEFVALSAAALARSMYSDDLCREAHFYGDSVPEELAARRNARGQLRSGMASHPFLFGYDA